MTDTTEPTTTPAKPGYKTTEFWFALAATALSALFASGALTNNTALAIAGMAATVLTALGYKVSRTLVKTAGMLLVVGLAVSQTGCATLRPRAAAGAGAFIDCEAAHLDGKLLADAIALAKSAVQHWIGGDGHVDVGGIKADAAPIKSDLGRCAFAAAIAAATAPAPTSAGAPASAPLEVDVTGLRVAFSEIKASWGVAAVQTSAGVQ